MPIIESKALPRSMIYTDEWRAYNDLRGRGYEHRHIPHAGQVYVMGNVHVNTIESLWSILKRGIAGVYHSVSAKHLQWYINEYAFRYNHRGDTQAMYRAFRNRVKGVRA